MLSAIAITVLLALVTTALLLLIGTPLSWGLARWRSPLKGAVVAVVCLPVVLPPTVIGFYLLLLLGPQGPGGFVARLWGGQTLAFSFAGLVIGSMVYSLPFAMQPLRLAFEACREASLQAAATLGANGWQRFWRIALPQARPGFITAGILCFAHTVGEFGIVMMVGGNIPGQTRMLSLEIFDAVNQGDYATAHALSLGLVGFSLVIIWLVMKLSGHWDTRLS